MEAFDQEICASLEEWMWQRWGTARLEEDLERDTTSILWPSNWTESPCRTQVRSEDPHDHALIEAREVHQRALEAAQLLEQNIERLSWAASKAKSTRCQYTYSHNCSRMWPQGRCPWSPGPTRPRKDATFQNQEEEMSSRKGPLKEPLGEVTGGGEVKESNLGPAPTLELGAGALPGGTNTHARCQGWVRLTARAINQQLWGVARMVGLPGQYTWLVEGVIPNAGDPKGLACKIHASFKVSQVRCKALKDSGDYTVPPAPKCIQRKMFLLVANSHLPCQDYWLKQLQSILA